MKTCTIMAVLLALFVNFVSAETIELYGEENYPPFSNASSNGLSNEVIKAAYKAVNIDVSFVPMPFARVTRSLLNEQGLGGFNIIKTPEAINDFIFPKQPIYQVNTHYYFNKNSNWNIKRLKDLDNKNLLVGQVIGFMYSVDFYQKNFTRFEGQSEEQLLNMLWHNRLDAAYITKEAEYYYRDKLGIPKDTVYFLPDIGKQQVPLYLAFNKNHPKAQYYADAFDQGLIKIKETGDYQKIVHNFFPF